MGKICAVCGGTFELGKTLRCDAESYEICYSCSDKFKKLELNEVTIDDIVSEETDSRILKYYSLPYEEREKKEQVENKAIVNNATINTNTANNSYNSAKKYNENDSKSVVGIVIKGLSVFVTLLAVLGGFLLYDSLEATALAIQVISLLVGSLCYGIGEIITLLTDIKNRMI